MFNSQRITESNACEATYAAASTAMVLRIPRFTRTLLTLLLNQYQRSGADGGGVRPGSRPEALLQQLRPPGPGLRSVKHICRQPRGVERFPDRIRARDHDGTIGVNLLSGDLR